MSRTPKGTTSRLKHKLALEAEVQTSDGQGGYSRSWQKLADIWAEILPLTGGQTRSYGSGNEVFGQGQIQNTLTHKILVRYRSGIDAGMRLVFEQRAFNIRYIANTDEAKDTLEILAEEGAAT